MDAAQYLRKSRMEEGMDTEEVLAKHRKALAEYAAANGIHIIETYYEVVSGESLYARPEMLRLLEDVEDGKYDAVLCMDLDRLSRGRMKDQGIILDSFKDSGTLIVTPEKTYDLSDEIDDELAEFKTFMSRREYKIINKRLQRGKAQTIRDGCYVANAPYGYRKVTIDRKPTLEIVESEAAYVRMMFDMYADGYGCVAIARHINTLGAKPRRCDAFNRSTVALILKNPVYIGKVVWDRTKHVRKGARGNPKHITIQQPRDHWVIVDGLHPAIIDKELFGQVQDIMAGRYIPPANDGTIKSPLAGLVKCGGCGNHCQLTVNTFADGRKFISGNRCDKPVTGKSEDNSLNLYAYKQQLLAGYKPVPGKRGSIGIPLCLNMYEMLPFWHTFWTRLGFAVHTSPVSSRGLYLAGQATIPSDTACFPAKLSHGHIKALSQMQLDAIFYPCLTYNFDEGLGDNHYNCPVVAYYPEVLAGNCPELEGKKFIYDYVGIHRPKDFVRKMAKEILPRYFGGISEKEVQAAADAAYAEHEAHMAQIRVKGSEIIDEARRQGRRIIVLAGRPYHVDPEVNHGIDHLITRHGAAVITEDSISDRVEKFPTSVLNQWTYHSRLYAAAKYCTTQKDMDLVQLVSFGCGVDAITTDETREILQEGGKLYTQLKIDEITNLGAVNIRLRSLFAALDERDEDRK